MVGKGQKQKPGHPHNWETGFRFLGEVIDEGLGLTTAEVAWAIDQEMALTLQDVLVRRLNLSHLTPDNARKLVPIVARIMASFLGWTKEEETLQISSYMDLVERELLFRTEE